MTLAVDGGGFSATSCLPLDLRLACSTGSMGTVTLGSSVAEATLVGLQGSFYANGSCTGGAVSSALPGPISFRPAKLDAGFVAGEWTLSGSFGTFNTSAPVTLTGRMTVPPLVLTVGVCTPLPKAQFVGLADLEPVVPPATVSFQVGALLPTLSVCTASTFELPAGQSETVQMPQVSPSGLWPGMSSVSASQVGGPLLGLSLMFGLGSCVGDGGVANLSSECCRPANFVVLSDGGSRCG